MALAKKFLCIFMIAIMVITIMPIMTFAEREIIASGTCGTCDWVIDSDGVLTFLGGEIEMDDWLYDESEKYPPWCVYAISKVKADGVVTLSTCENLFYRCSTIYDIDLRNFDTSSVENMNGMFKNCSSLQQLNISSIDTGNVKDMGSMFEGCASLQELDLGSFDTSNVVDMYYMFDGCSSLQRIKLSSFNTSSVESMWGMFWSCSSLQQLDLSSFDTSKVSNMGRMFQYCKALTDLDLSSFDTSNVRNMAYMFYGCYSIQSIDVRSFNTGNVTTMESMFDNCSCLKTLDVSRFDTTAVTTMNNMFNKCASLKEIDVSKFNTANVEYMYRVFAECSSVSKLDLSNFDIQNTDQLTNMFYKCNSLTCLIVGENWHYTTFVANSLQNQPQFPVRMVDSENNIYEIYAQIPNKNNTTYVAEGMVIPDDPDPINTLPIDYAKDTWNIDNDKKEAITLDHYNVLFDFPYSVVACGINHIGSSQYDGGNGGVCFGLALSVLASYLGYPPISDYRDKTGELGYAENLSEVTKDSFNTTSKEKAIDFIKIANTYQYTYDGIVSNKLLRHKDDYDGLYQAAYDFHYNDGDPVLVTLFKNNPRVPQHELAILGIKGQGETDDGEYVDIGVYDSNKPGQDTALRLLGAPGNFTGFIEVMHIHEGGDYYQVNPDYKSSNGYHIGYVNIVQHFIDHYKAAKNGIKINNGDNTLISFPIEFYTQNGVTIKGKDLVAFKNLFETETDWIFSLPHIFGEGETENGLCWLKGNSEWITFGNVPAEAEIGLACRETVVYVKADNQTNISINEYDGSAKIDGDPGTSFEVTYEVKNDEAIIDSKVTGIIENTVEVTNDNGTITVTGAKPSNESGSESGDDPITDTGTKPSNESGSESGDDPIADTGTDSGSKEEDTATTKPAHTHTYGDWTTTTPATEIADGVQTRTCTECGNTETLTIAKLKPTLKAVPILKPKAAKKSVTIKWKKVSKKNLKKTKKIQIQYSTDKTFKKNVKNKYVSAKKTSYKIKGLKTGKKYYVRIRAYTKSKGMVHISKWSTKKPFKVK